MSSLFTYDNFIHALAGSVANGTAMTVFYPLDTVRSKLQLENDRKAKGTIATMIDLVNEDGISSLYNGLQPVLISLFTSSFVYFYSFHGLRRLGGEKTALKDLTFGALAGVVNVLTTTPMWVVNTRIKMQKTNSAKDSTRMIKQEVDEEQSKEQSPQKQHYSGIIDGLVKISNNEGLDALWSGTGPSLLLVSNPAIQFMIFELLKRNLKATLQTKELSPYHIFALGSVSKSISTLISYPLQVVQSKKRYGSPEVKSKPLKQILADIVERDGPAGLYKGMEAKLLQTVLTTSLMYVFYERIYSFVTKVGKSI